MQGTACAYDLAVRGDAAVVRIADIDLEVAERSAARVNALAGRDVAVAIVASATDPEGMGRFIDGLQMVVSAVPYPLHKFVAQAAIRSGVSVVDMGNDTSDTLEILAMSDMAGAKGITVIPDTGLAPGLVNSLAVYLMDQLDATEAVRLYCGGLPQNPKPPFKYKLSFSLEGLIGEYLDEAIVIRDGRVVELPTLDEVETLHVDGFGELEAFTTSGGTSTAPYTFNGRVRTYEYKTIRYPGHCALMRQFRDLGFWSPEPVRVGDQFVSPFEVFCKLVGPRLIDDTDRDVVITRCAAIGRNNGSAVERTIELVEHHDEVTGFSAMERMTGFSAAICAHHVAQGNVKRGSIPYETAIPGALMVSEWQRRGATMRETERPIDD